MNLTNKRFNSLLVVLFLIIIFVIYAYISTKGTFSIRQNNGYYNFLGEAFASGQTHLKIKPNTQLFKLADPYDPKQNTNYALHDASLYKGKYYLYWGPAPAVFYAVWILITNLPVFDGFTVPFFAFINVILFWLILGQVSELIQLRKPWLKWVFTVMFALGSTSLFLIRTPSIYHESIVIAALFLLAGQLTFLKYLERENRFYLILTSVFLSTAVATRLSYIAYAVPFIIITLWYEWKIIKTLSSRINKAIIIACPIVTVLILLLLYNKARFNQFFEFGLHYQLVGLPIHRQLIVSGEFQSIQYIIYGLKAYLLRLPQINFPYFLFPLDYTAFPTEYTSSIFFNFPLAIFSALALTPSKFKYSVKSKIFVMIIIFSLILTILGLSTIFGVSKRYEYDFLPSLLILAFIGSQKLLSHLEDKKVYKILTMVTIVLLGFWSISIWHFSIFPNI